MGGRAKAAARLDHFLRELNGGTGGTHTDHALLGNEPTLHVALALRLDAAALPHPGGGPPRRSRLYDTSPDGYPGNDDLGTLSVLVRVRGARPLPGGARASGCWRSAARCSARAVDPRVSRTPHGRAQIDPPPSAQSRSARPRLHRGVRSTATPTAGPGPPTARSPAAAARLPARPAPNRQWGDAAAAGPPPSARHRGCRTAPASPEPRPDRA